MLLNKNSITNSKMAMGKYWCFTINNPTRDTDDLDGSANMGWLDLKRLLAAPDLTYCICQLEQGEEKTQHLQGYLELSKNSRLSALKILLPRAHLETRKGTQQQAIDYCSKAESRLEGPWEHGEKKENKQGQRTDLSVACALLKEKGLLAVSTEYPHLWTKHHKGFQSLYDMGLRHDKNAGDREIILLYGPPGCGKTRTFMEGEEEGCKIHASSGFWFDGYRQEEAALLDDFDGKASKWTLHQCLEALDRYQCRLPIKGSFTWWCPKRIYITTNLHPRLWFDWEKREQQWPALTRRFTKLITWDDSGNRREHEPGSESWLKFLDYPSNFMPGATPYNYF